ncbi:histone acetyltransferase-like protein [Angomonas deanei]|uniref:Radical SAM superfamily/Radical_SAM C-terminal domain containing protein, putative n=1 Tax=Angomonas deanei TaxID=59799 RepID=A0A7G2BZF1_9TRYP|nr:histone acetyltransferase-like protein [Angomonas deanei]CAD2212665.1 Radical SAM superfamily/Radical_SAM C-terminal domain containing protein, putative [Angomonas deanei]|eukprot:EPY24394.1 histone acetyltransferase-like protein [Angomonas deanei]
MSSEDDEPTPLSALEMERINTKIRNLPTLEGLLKEEDPNAFSDEQIAEAAQFVKEIALKDPQSVEEVPKIQRQLHKKYKKVFKKSLLLAGYKHMLSVQGAVGGTTLPDVEDCVGGPSPNSGPLYSPVLESFLVSKAPRSQSGVLVVTVFTSAYPDGQKFSCQWNCYYCPNEPGQPRSYLLNEPGVRRANRLEFDPYRQFEDRVLSLVAIGHPADKVELLVLGGTWESYPTSYRERFIRDLFYAANTIFDTPDLPRRPPLDLLQEQLLNESAKCKIIGVTLETRPDTLNLDMLVELRRYGCTRVQLGIQHTDNSILSYVNRQSTRDDAVQAIKLLKDSGFKVDVHLMPDLPGSSPEADRLMFDDMLNSPYLQADQWKIYPCQTTPFSVIEQWYKDGTYKPYGMEKLIEVLLYAKERVHPWIRLNRVIRDIPADYILGGVDVANLRQLLALKLKERGSCCRCIRCREVKGSKEAATLLQSAVVKERRYDGSEGTELFISVETEDEKIVFGFLRLRFNIRNWETPFAELRTCALIRELHVYGNLIPTYDKRDGTAKKCNTRESANNCWLGRRVLQNSMGTRILR